MNDKKKSAKSKAQETKEQVQVPELADAAVSTETNTDTVYRVSKDKGELTVMSREAATAELTASTVYSLPVIEKAYEKGQVLATEAATFSVKRKKLEKLVKSDLTGETSQGDTNAAPDTEKPSESAETPASDTSASDEQPKSDKVAIKEGDFAQHSDGKRWGEVKTKDGKLKVFFVHPSNGNLTSVNLSKDWSVLTAEEVQAKRDAQALATQDSDAIQGEPVLPLTEEEKQELAERENNIDNAKQTAINAEKAIAVEISIVREKALWRESKNTEGETFKSFIEYATNRFGFEQKATFRLAQIGDFARTFNGILPENSSLNVALSLITDANKLKELLGIQDESGWNQIKPIVTNSIQLMLETAPKDKKGEPVITPRIVSKFNETLTDVLTSKKLEVDGKEMKLEKAVEQGVANDVFRNQVLESVAESIKTNEQYIVEKAKAAYERKTEPVTNGGEKRKQLPLSGAREFYNGKVPTYAPGQCAKHSPKDAEAGVIIDIGNGVFQTKCKCRWHISDTSNRLECFECEGLPVKR